MMTWTPERRSHVESLLSVGRVRPDYIVVMDCGDVIDMLAEIDEVERLRDIIRKTLDDRGAAAAMDTKPKRKEAQCPECESWSEIVLGVDGSWQWRNPSPGGCPRCYTLVAIGDGSIREVRDD